MLHNVCACVHVSLSHYKVAAPEPLVSTNTSACPVKATTLKSAASKTRTDLPDNDNLASSRSLNIECDNVDRQLHIYCRPQGSLTNLTFEESQYLHKFTFDDKPQAASKKLHLHLMPDSKSPPLPPCLENFINKYQISTCSRTPINILALSSELVSHPNCHFVNTLLDNLTEGCNIGYTRPQFNHCSRTFTQHTSTLLSWMPPLLRNAS